MEGPQAAAVVAPGSEGLAATVDEPGVDEPGAAVDQPGGEEAAAEDSEDSEDVPVSSLGAGPSKGACHPFHSHLNPALHTTHREAPAPWWQSFEFGRASSPRPRSQSATVSR